MFKQIGGSLERDMKAEEEVHSSGKLLIKQYIDPDGS